MADIRRLPGPVADLWDWQLRGSCRGEDSALFFHPEGERGSSRESRDAAAKQVCAGCPVAMECLKYALATREPYGVWGGLSESERAEILAGTRPMQVAS
jgi:WhiB family transcriptional regulator, redox-sensing transcriptional regulator